MKILSPEIKDHITKETTTLCRCWIIKTIDGHELGFTDHDVDITLNGVTCEKNSGIDSSDIEERIGLSTNTNEISGALQSDCITTQDINDGKYDNAQISTFIVNWQNLTQNFLDQVSLVGEIFQEDGNYRMEMRSYVSELDQTKGSHFIKKCQANLGDGKCRVSLDNSEFTASGIIYEVKSNTVIWVNGLSAFESNWFRGGNLTWLSGENNNRKIEVTEHIKLGDFTILHLWQPMPKEIKINDNFSIKVGCNKEFSTCLNKFSNTINFRGYPHMPGNSFVLSYAGNSEVFDGGPIIK